MSAEKQTNLNAPTAAPAIENEFATYRAICPSAVVALILGVFSLLGFVSIYFLAVPVLAIVFGAFADRKIQRYPEILTGRGLAQAGIALGLVFGLTAVTVLTVQSMIRGRQGLAYARAYEKILRDGTFADAVWMAQSPQMRATSSPEEMMKQAKGSASTQSIFEERYHAINEIKRAINAKAELRFVRIEGHGDQDLTQYAGAVYAVHDHDAKGAEDPDRYILAVIKWDPRTTKGLNWWVPDVVFPYKEKTFIAPAPDKKADDGHGHSH